VFLDRIKAWFRGAADAVEEEADGEEPVATPGGADDVETSTNAQVEGAAGEPYPGND
jgi:hypothetical protein